MKYKEIYTTEEYMEMLCEVSYIEPPNCMIYLIDSLNRLNKILAISNKSEFGKILLAKNRLEPNPDMTTKLIYDSIKTEYKNKILQFLDGLALHAHHLENGILVNSEGIIITTYLVKKDKFGSIKYFLYLCKNKKLCIRFSF